MIRSILLIYRVFLSMRGIFRRMIKRCRGGTFDLQSSTFRGICRANPLRSPPISSLLLPDQEMANWISKEVAVAKSEGPPFPPTSYPSWPKLRGCPPKATIPQLVRNGSRTQNKLNAPTPHPPPTHPQKKPEHPGFHAISAPIRFCGRFMLRLVAIRRVSSAAVSSFHSITY